MEMNSHEINLAPWLLGPHFKCSIRMSLVTHILDSGTLRSHAAGSVFFCFFFLAKLFPNWIEFDKWIKMVLWRSSVFSWGRSWAIRPLPPSLTAPPPCHLHPQKSCSTSACPWNSMEQLTSGRNLSTEQMAHIQNPGPLELRGILAYIEAQPHPSCSAEIR